MSNFSLLGSDGHGYSASLSRGAISVTIAGNSYLLRTEGDRTVIEHDGVVVHHNRISPEALEGARRMREAVGG